MDLRILIFHVKCSRMTPVFLIWLCSPSIAFRAGACQRFILFSWLSGSQLWMDHILSVHNPEDGRLGGFHLSALVNGVLL